MEGENKFTKNNGFTLIEILAAVTILGIVSLVAIIGVSKTTAKAEKEYYDKLEKNIQLSTKSYTQINRNNLPKNVGEKTTIPLRKIVDKNFIEDIKDYHDGECDLDNSYIKIFKYSQTKYTYSTVLKCDNYKNDEIEKTTQPVVKINFDKKSDKNYAEVKISSVSENSAENPIYIYNYNVRITSNKNIVYNSGEISGEESQNITKKFYLDQYIPGEIEINVIATNSLGNTVKEKANHNYKDERKPECIIASEDSSRTEWSTGIRTITVGCTDKDSGCERKEYTKNFKEDQKYGYISIKDKSGNVTKCKVNVYLDNTPPKIENVVNDSNSKWTNKNVTVNAKATDNLSGISEYYYGYSNNDLRYNDLNLSNNNLSGVWSGERNNELYLIVKDRAGNKSLVANAGMIKIDKTKPVITSVSNSSNGNWTNQNVNISATASDSASGINKFYYGYAEGSVTTEKKNTSGNTMTGTWSAERNNHLYLAVTDIAGNKSEIKSANYVKIDKTPPVINSISNSSNGNWTNKDVTIRASGSDNLSGISQYYYGYSSNNVNNTDITTSGNNMSGTWGAQRNNRLYLKAKDRAGNISAVKDANNIKIDKTSPSCSVNLNGTRGSNNWFISNTSVSLSKSDGYGEISNYGLTTSGSTNYNGSTNQTQRETKGTTWYGYVKDKAGNTTRCSTSLKVDTTKPTCSLYVSSGRKAPENGAYYRPTTISIKSKSDGTSGIWQYGLDRSSGNSYNYGSSETQNTPNSYVYYGHVKDYAGNENKCSLSVKVKYPYSCKSGETLVEDKGICVFNSWNDRVSKTCTRSSTCTRAKTCTRWTTCGGYGTCYRNVKVSCGSPWSWYCASGWAGPGCYRTDSYSCWEEYDCEESYTCYENYPCQESYDCSYYQRTCRGYSTYSGSGDSLKCYRQADLG